MDTAMEVDSDADGAEPGEELSQEERSYRHRIVCASKSYSTTSVRDTGVERLEIAPHSPAGLQKLRVIRNERLVGISDTIGELSQLVSLNLCANPALRQLPSTLGCLRSLRFLCLRLCELASLPPTLSSLVNLEHLDCSANNIVALPQGMHLLTKLHTMSFADNPLQATIAGSSFACMAALKSVDFSNCCLKSVPAELFSLPRLRRVLLEGNSGLQELPPTVDQLWRKASTHRYAHRLWDGTALASLPCLDRVTNVSHFQIKLMRNVHMPKDLSHMHFTRLTMLDCNVSDLTNCMLPGTIRNAVITNAGQLDETSLDPLLASADTMRSLVLDFNGIPSIPDNFSAFTALCTLSISTNPLKAFSATAAAGLRSLQTLRASNCSLSDMAPICLISSLQTLVLRDNVIEEVPPGISNLRDLRSFDISNNQVWKFDSGLATLTNLVRLTLTNNPATFELLGNSLGVLCHQIGPTLAAAFSRRVGRKTKRASAP